LISALIGAAIAFAFVSLTALSVWLGGRLNLGGFYGVVLGGWILKVLIFLIIVGVLRHAEFINGPTLFFTLVASILGSLGIDSWVFLKARLPIEA
jgi:energy-converting hydrogenase Eha subunit B